ncbi:hypothetical protein BU23DRAFT_451407 [Bimuria novae-zelandiae CBS 107.79]|uniref:N-acetyltransferase domain-containing protein n=1 Tax=Bimuria novae-zelandiae CBS 107.79 TaxID=1447943 RepID=A0A6A5VMY9_9PLEO|nr:hypothetical protein BU23DRAFT_451407 [Bimuria novae-zelandiae CBS 107.79]
MSSVPVLPFLDGIRLATVDDLSRIAIVAAAGFFHSPTFHYQRVHHAAYPEDTLLSYWTEYDQAMKDPMSVVLVAEDVLKENEGDDEYPALKNAATYRPMNSSIGSKVVVGVASICMGNGSAYTGMFQAMCELASSSESRLIPANPNRDCCKERVRIYNEATAPAKARHLAGLMRLSTLSVHPAYWRRGHASRLFSWSTRLADLDGVPMGISAVSQGAIIAARAGFEERELVRVPRACGDSATSSVDGPKGVEMELWVAIRHPCGTPASRESATSLESQ